MFIFDMVTCGNSGFLFDERLPRVISTIVGIIKIGVPVLFVIFGMLDLGKAVIASKEEEIKRHQSMFIKRLIVGALVFFVFAFTELFVSFIAPNDESDIIPCMNCFIKDDCMRIIPEEEISINL